MSKLEKIEKSIKKKYNTVGTQAFPLSFVT